MENITPDPLEQSCNIFLYLKPSKTQSPKPESLNPATLNPTTLNLQLKTLLRPMPSTFNTRNALNPKTLNPKTLKP